MPETATGTTIINTRVLPSSPAEVYAAFRDPEVLRHWWGPQGFTNTFHEFDFRPGGRWLYTMHGPDGSDYANECQFVELAPAKKLVILHLRTMHRFTLTISLTEQSGQTAFTWHQHFDQPLASQELVQFITQANEQNLDRLAAALRQSAA